MFTWIYTIIGLIASGLVAIYSIPQLIYILKTKNTSGISFWMFVLFCLGCFLFTLYGLLMAIDLGVGRFGTWLPILVANFVATISGTIILTYKTNNLLTAKHFAVAEKEVCEKYFEYKVKRAERKKAKKQAKK